MDDVLGLLIKIYRVEEYDWMKFRITRDNPLTYHHIIKEAKGGKKTLKNGAPLTILAHQYLHQIEYDDNEIFVLINKQLEKINRSGNPPTKTDLKIIQSLLYKYEKHHDVELRKKIRNTPYNPKKMRAISPQKDLFSPTNLRVVMQEGVNPYGYPVKKKHKKRGRR